VKSQSPTEIDIFNAALELDDPVQRERYLSDICAGNTALRTRLDALLDAHGRGVAMFEPLAPAVSRFNSELAAGDRIGSYHVIEKLGEGGCGVVYIAEQQQPLRRRVALKIIKAGMDTRAVITRFEAERQALALMDHSNIAKVFDAGSTEAGRPYFVMELVKGLRITDYCVQHNLSVRERLNLFLQVCDAVQHAHQKGIIHRDLKPSNILVQTLSATSSESLLPSFPAVQHSALPKVIDFGIAKAIQGKLTNETIHTALHQFIGTPAYMSPEQADLSPDIDTRTDIYSLGVLLYELLTGKPPFDNHELLTAGLDEMRRIIREVEPKRPSQSSLANLLDPDLDWVILKCIEKDRSRRYESAASLIRDVQRHLRSEPITARPHTAAYRFRKFVDRNRILSFASASVFVALLTGGGLAGWAFFRERSEHGKAEHRLRAALGFVSAVSDKVLPDLEVAVGGAQALESLAVSGLSFIQELRSSAGDDPGLTIAVAKVLVRLSRVQGSYAANHMGDFEAALKTGQNAISLLEMSDETYEPGVRAMLLADAYQRAATSLENLGRPEEALHVRKTRLNALLENLTHFPEYRWKAADNSVLNQTLIGLNLLDLGRPVEAAHSLSNLLASDISRQLAKSTNSDDWQRLAGLHAPLAFVYETLGDWPATLLHATAAIELCNSINKAGSMTLAHRRFRSMEQSVKANALAEMGRASEAQTELVLSSDFLESDTRTDLGSWAAQENYVISMSRIVRTYSALARHSDAAEARARFDSQAVQALKSAESALSSMQPLPRSRSILNSIDAARGAVAPLLHSQNRPPP
jgi:serine/threonine protein kinase/tetratricopeptide (TPR) repeat protein